MFGFGKKKDQAQIQAENEKNEKSLVSGEPVRFGGFNGDRLLTAIVFTATVGFSLFGYDQGLMSGIIGSEQFNREFPATKQDPALGGDDVHTGTVRGSVTACYEVGCFFGALFAYFVGDKFGRRKMMLIGGWVMIAGTIITVSSFGPGDPPRGNVGGFVQFIIGRVITGLGNGANTATIPSWVAESSKAHNRGFLICIEASTVAVGTVIAYWIDFGLSYVDQGGVSWRFPIAFQIFFAFILIGGVMFLPESPRWLMAKRRDEEAQKVVAALAGVSYNDPIAIAEKNKISDALAAMASTRAARKSDILKGGKNQHMQRALVGASTQLFQQIGGCNAVIYYSTILFEDSIGMTGRLPLIMGGVLSVVYACFALTSFLLVERVGRRRLFLIGTIGQGVAMFITFACLQAGGDENAKGAAVGLFVFIAFFGATWLPLPWLYPAELNSMAVRTEANAISTMTNWLSNFLVVQVLPTMTASIGPFTFLLFAVANMMFLPFIYFFYPETSGRSLEELDVLYAHSHITKRRATFVAADLPKLTDHQVQVMTERYDIHNGAMEFGHPEAYGAEANQGEPDTTLPPAEGSRGLNTGNKAIPGEPGYNSSSGDVATGENTRVPTPTGETEGIPKPQ